MMNDTAVINNLAMYCISGFIGESTIWQTI